MNHLSPRRLVLAVAVVALANFPAVAADKDADDLAFQSAVGVVSEVKPEQKQLVLKVRKKEPITLTVDDRSRIDFPQTDGKLAKLPEGKRVRVTYYAKDGTNRLLSLTEPRVTLGKIQEGINLAFNFAKSASFKQRDEYKKNLHTVVQDVDEQIESLEAQGEKADGDNRKQINQNLEELRRQRDLLRKRLAQVDAANEDNWTEVRDNANAILGDVQRLIERTRAAEKDKS